jgi:hypothetical protein
MAIQRLGIRTTLLTIRSGTACHLEAHFPDRLCLAALLHKAALAHGRIISCSYGKRDHDMALAFAGRGKGRGEVGIVAGGVRAAPLERLALAAHTR